MSFDQAFKQHRYRVGNQTRKVTGAYRILARIGTSQKGLVLSDLPSSNLITNGLLATESLPDGRTRYHVTSTGRDFLASVRNFSAADHSGLVNPEVYQLLKTLQAVQPGEWISHIQLHEVSDNYSTAQLDKVSNNYSDARHYYYLTRLVARDLVRRKQLEKRRSFYQSTERGNEFADLLSTLFEERTEGEGAAK